MANLDGVGGKKCITVKPDGLIELREPTTEEWNTYQQKRSQFRNGKVKSQDDIAKAWLFDKLCTRIENIQVNGQTVTCETLDKIATRTKAKMIFQAFEEDAEDIDIKNS